jgi:hypothetical protein
MIFKRILASMFIFALASFTTSDQIRTISLKDHYLSFRDKTKNTPLTDKTKLFEAFKDAFLTSYPELYNQGVFGKRNSNTSLEEHIEPQLAKFVEYIRDQRAHNRIVKLFNDFSIVTKEEINRFNKNFPDFDFQKLTYVSAISLLGTNGALRHCEGKPTLIFGIDSIIQRQDDLALLFSHEIVHAYHEQTSPNMMDDSRNHPFLRMMFQEGLATYTSGVLNPDKSKDKYFDPELSEWCSSGTFKEHLDRYIDDQNMADHIARTVSKQGFILQNSQDEEKKAKAKALIEQEFSKWRDLEEKWFLIGDNKPKGMLLRAAYCIGDKVIEKILEQEKINLSDLFKWDFESVKKNVEIALDALKNKN